MTDANPIPRLVARASGRTHTPEGPPMTLAGQAVLALLDAILRPLLLIILVACVVVVVSIARDVLATAYSEPEG